MSACEPSRIQLKLRVPVPLGEVGICLTRGRSVNRVEKRNQFRIECQCVRLNERKRIIPLRLNIDPYNLKPGLTVTDPCATRATE
jgi:hypothetical protein